MKPDGPLIRQARLAEALTLAWMVVELVVALWAGIAARSVALRLRRRQRHRTVHCGCGAAPVRPPHRARYRGGTGRARTPGVPARRAGDSTGSSPTSSPRRCGASQAAADRSPRAWASRSPSRRSSSCRCCGAGGSAWRGASTARPCAPMPPVLSSASDMSAVLLAGLVLNSLFGWWWADLPFRRPTAANRGRGGRAGDDLVDTRRGPRGAGGRANGCPRGRRLTAWVSGCA